MWSVLPATDQRRRDGIGFDVDDDAGEQIVVPGHWRNASAFADSDGPLLYRRRFSSPPPPEGRRRWLTFDGIFYQADVWLDGAYLGDPEGYFMSHSFDITALSRIDDDHVVAAEISCPPERGVRGRRNVTGIFQHWDGLDRRWNPGGIWGPVRVHDTGPIRIERLRVLCRDADEGRAHLLCTAMVDSDAARGVTLCTYVDGELLHEQDRRVAAGVNEVNWSLDIIDPELWWPRSLGDQPLSVVELDVLVDGVSSDRHQRRTGFREVAWNNWTCSINGEPIFVKAANLLPTAAGLADASPESLRADVRSLVDAGLDGARVHGHIAPHEVYDAADEMGLLFLQDFPLQWGYQRSVRRSAMRQARIAVDHLGHHPSIVQWNAHNEPASVGVGFHGDGPRTRARYVAAHQLPSWNRTVLDRWVKRTIELADPTRLTVPHSGVLPHLPLLDGTDSHFYFGWYHGAVADLERLARRVPRLVRFVSEFGAQSVPADADFIDADAWPDLDWEHLADRYGLQKWVFDERVPPHEYASFDSWVRATQRYQADLLKRHIETLRRLKYRPAGGFALFAWNDPAPLVSWSVLDHRRVPKPAHAAVVDACRPVIVTADYPPDYVSPGDELGLSVHVVNDLRQPVQHAVVEATARWNGGSRRWQFGGDIEADAVTRVGRLEMSVPDTLGVLRISLSLRFGDARVDNRYSTAVTLRPD